MLRKSLSKRAIYCSMMFILFSLSPNLFSQARAWDLLYPAIERPVAEMKFSSIAGISSDGLLFALPGNNGGLAYFTDQNSLNIFNFATNLGAVSIVADESNNRIFCAFGSGSNSDGLYEFNLNLQEFELIDWYFSPNFVKRLSSGFYCGYGDYTSGGLAYSTTGDEWSEVEFFNSKNVTDIEENSVGTLFISAGNEVYIENEGTYTSLTTPSIITDIYARYYPYSDEIYLASGGGSYSDAVYRVEYENNEITSLTKICELFQPNTIYEYENLLVVGCIDYLSNLFLVEPVENGQVQQIAAGLGINEVYCFEFYPIYTPNFMVGTDSGVYLFTNITSIEDQQIEEVTSFDLRNFPNPFNLSGAGRGPNTTIEFSLQNDSEVELLIYNVKGQKVKTLIHNEILIGHQALDWNGSDAAGKAVSSGVYYYKLNINGKTEAVQKCLLLK